MLIGGLLLVLRQYMPIYIIVGVFIIIKGVLIYIINVSTKTSVVYSYKVLIAIGASLIL
jgi:hypothetical protein